MQMEAEEVQLQGAQIVEILGSEWEDEKAGMEDGGVEEQMVMAGVGMQGMGQKERYGNIYFLNKNFIYSYVFTFTLQI